MSLETQTEVKGSDFIVKIIGLLDYSTIDNFNADIPKNIKKVIIDLSKLDFIDSTGIGSILSIIYTASDSNLNVEFEGLSDVTHELFDTVGVFGIMEALLKGGQ